MLLVKSVHADSSCAGVSGAFGSTPVLYDQGNNAASPNPNVKPRGNGNIIDDGKRLNQFDALNRLIQVKRKSDGLVIAAYTYDAMEDAFAGALYRAFQDAGRRHRPRG